MEKIKRNEEKYNHSNFRLSVAQSGYYNGIILRVLMNNENQKNDPMKEHK